MLNECVSLTSVPLFNTSNVTNMIEMFQLCSSLKSIPLLDTSSVTDMSGMCEYCYNVESGALALYQQASSQATPPGHTNTFTRCGVYTTTGAAELAQIPSDWGGTGA
jgi:surface protein